MRTFHHREFPAERFAERRSSISVCVPALNEAATIGATVRILAELRERGAIDQVVVVDGASTDDTARIAAEHGAEVHQQDGLLPQLGPVLGAAQQRQQRLVDRAVHPVSHARRGRNGTDPADAATTLGRVRVTRQEPSSR